MMHQSTQNTPTAEADRMGRWAWAVLLLLAGLSVLAGLLVHGHPHFDIESVFGFQAGLALLACLLVVGVAKLFCMVLGRPDDYYWDTDD